MAFIILDSLPKEIYFSIIDSMHLRPEKRKKLSGKLTLTVPFHRLNALHQCFYERSQKQN